MAFELLIQGSKVFGGVADKFRKPLIAKGVGDGSHGFRVALKEHWLAKDPTLKSLVLRALPSNKEFKLAPKPGELQEVKTKSEVGQRSTGLVEPGSAVPEITSLAEGSAEDTRLQHPEFREILAARLANRVTLPAQTILEEIEAILEGRWTTAPAQTPTVKSIMVPKAQVLLSLEDEQQNESVSQILSAVEPTAAQLKKIVSILFKEKNWRVLIGLGHSLEGKIQIDRALSIQIARANIYEGKFSTAVNILRSLDLETSRDLNGLYYLAISLRQQGLYAESFNAIEACLKLGAKESKFFLEGARSKVLAAYGGYGEMPENRLEGEDAAELFRKAAETDEKSPIAWREYSRLLVSLGRLDEALAAAREDVVRLSKDERSHLNLAKILTRLGHYKEAEAATVTAVEIAPGSDTAKFSKRIAQRLYEHASGIWPDSLFVAGRDSRPYEILRSQSEDWIGIGGEADAPRMRLSIARGGFPWAGALVTYPGRDLIYRSALLRSAFECGVLNESSNWSDCETFAMLFAAISYPDEAGLRPFKGSERGTALLLSQYGIRKFGGAEQFLDQAARIYASLGLDVLVVGTRSEFVGESGVSNGLNYVFVDGSPESLMSLAVQHRASVVHVVSGLGLEAAAAFRFMDVAVVFGVHFWRELIVQPTPSEGYYPDVDGSMQSRPEFNLLLSDAYAVYANSDFTRGVVEQRFGVRLPVVYSLPPDLDAEVRQPTATAAGDCVLLANSRDDKGFGLILQVAGRLPNRKFIAIANQGSAEKAALQIASAGVSNVELLGRVDDMTEVYRRARVVAVPSYRFVETFSRMVIEAHRHGIPVVGSDRGNVPLLLQDSGVSLPEDAESWANEIEHLFADDDYWTARSIAGLENSARFSFAQQRSRIRGLVSSRQSPILIGVGSGIGNILHCTPLIRNIARRLGRRVDVVVAGDHGGLMPLVGHPDYVNHVFELNDAVLARRYATVFLTHCFGEVIPRFACSRVFSSREWRIFGPDDTLHEAEFNLAAAEAMLGIPYDIEDVRGAFVGGYSYVPPDRPLVGFHAGSKGGIWASKRWPHFESLAEVLTRAGVDVASFGTKDEYVTGTRDMTGGSVDEMARAMLDCSYFVANDSGVMNIANALGIPTLALFAPTNALTRGPLAPTSQSLAVVSDCAPCEIHTEYRKTRFLSGECRCIGEISLDQVLSAIWPNIESLSEVRETSPQ
ncbi:MAG: glycosyltransferase [Caulobacter sp.]|nr:glycosyltransferase [Caulobacter sp.]